MKKPCNDCPFRRKSAPGWIGGHSHPQEITDIVLSEQKFPCHVEVEKDRQINQTDFEEACEKADPCQGSIIFMKNQCKLPRSNPLKQLVKDAKADSGVFRWAHEFVEHHKKAVR